MTDYSNATSLNTPLRVQITLNDLSVSSTQVALQARFTGNGINFTSNPTVIGATPIFLEGGFPTTLQQTELAPYFEFGNITGISPEQYGAALPEGAYQFCFQVTDFFTGRTLSNESCANVYIYNNDPPILVFPTHQSTQETTAPNLFFQWTPRHINVSNVQYELSLVEVWDTNVDPQTAFLSSVPVFTTTTTQPSYLYTQADPLLLLSLIHI